MASLRDALVPPPNTPRPIIHASLIRSRHCACALDWIRFTNCHALWQLRRQRWVDHTNVGPLSVLNFTGISAATGMCKKPAVSSNIRNASTVCVRLLLYPPLGRPSPPLSRISNRPYNRVTIAVECRNSLTSWKSDEERSLAYKQKNH